MAADQAGSVRLIDVATGQTLITLQSTLSHARSADWHPLDPMRYRVPRRA